MYKSLKIVAVLVFVTLISATLIKEYYMEYTLSIIKPDATARNLTADINNIFINNGLEVVAQKEMVLTEKQAQEFYIEHKDRPFYDELVEYMTSGPVVVQVLAGKNAIAKNREIMGATNPQNAEEGTIRNLFAESLSRNSVHGSDSEKAAEREIDFFFDYNEVTNKN